MQDFKTSGSNFVVHDQIKDPRVYVFLRQQTDGVDATSINQKLLDTLVLFALEDTDPDENIFLNKKQIVQKISGTLKFEPRLLINNTDALTQIIRLNQLASNPRLLIKNFESTGAKFSKLDEIIKNKMAKNQKVIIWTSYRKNVFEICERYKSYGTKKLTGGLGSSILAENAESFQNGEDTKILVATPQCAREGFTLTSSHVAIYLDRSFSLLDWVQSQDRIHRISQTKECEIHVLRATDTIDERIEEVLDKKNLSQQNMLGDINSQSSDELDLDTIKKILYSV